ncbi:MAG TPA: alpha/beta fold hydrolase [Acidobacteriaceae bacterium]|jgi:pimeloyl-ACP methyl ester carboxylesterase|nr:alpha/beta fold hydrolase [Acidobacteriaceae bacterium]
MLSRLFPGSAVVFLVMFLANLAPCQTSGSMSVQQRQGYLQKLEKILPAVPGWSEWQQKTGTLPPDFTSLPKHNELPDPLTFLDGRPVRTPADWAKRRQEILELSEKYEWGKVPPLPTIARTVVESEHRGDGYTVRNLRFLFGPGEKGSLRARVVIPDGTGPMPALINSDLLGWAPELIRRGYISAGYAGNDFMDDAAPLSALYPGYDFALLPRRAWCASLVVDYLYTLPQVDKKHIAIFGYSRNGKMISIAAALDPRITAVIAGSTGVGGVLPWRATGERGSGESIESTTREFPTWFAPQLRFFAGREDRLPVDGNLLAAIIAPRPLLMEWGNNDEVSSTWGNEQTYYTALKVYKLLGVPNRISTLRVPGFHGANDEGADLDWLDMQFGRSERPWTNNLIFQWDWNRWRTNTHQSLDVARFKPHPPDDLLTTVDGGTIQSVAQWQAKSDELRKSVESMLGTEPPRLSADDLNSGSHFHFRPRPANAPNPGQVTPDLPAWVIDRGGTAFGWLEPEKSETASRRVHFGDAVTGDLYYPADTPPGKKLPAVVWLHGYSYPLGYMWVYREDLHPILALVHAGYAVLAYDQSGFGSRLSEAGPFYDRYPQWSRMGRLVEDAGAATNFLAHDAMVDPSRVYLFGFSLGGNVALYTAALNPNVKGVVSIVGFTPMRTDTLAKGTGGVGRYAFERGLIPRLGFFVGHEKQIPYDYDGLLAMIAPRPALVVESLLDRDATPSDVSHAVDQARRVYTLYGAQDSLGLMEPWDYNRLPTYLQDQAIDWMKQHEP